MGEAGLIMSNRKLNFRVRLTTHNHTFSANSGPPGSASWKLEPPQRIHRVLLWLDMVFCGVKRRHDSVTLWALLQVRGCPVFGSLLFLAFNRRHVRSLTCLCSVFTAVLWERPLFPSNKLFQAADCHHFELHFTLKHALVHKEYDLSLRYTNISSAAVGMRRYPVL